MDEMNKDMEPAGTGQSEEPEKNRNQEEVKIWHKKQENEKKVRFVYEVTPPDEQTASGDGDAPGKNGDSGDNFHAGPDSGMSSEESASENRDYQNKTESGESGEGTFGSGAAGEGTSERAASGRNASENEAAAADGRASNRTTSAGGKKSKKRFPGNNAGKEENPLEKDNLSKKARQDFWRKQVVEGTAGQNSVFRHVLKWFKRYYKKLLATVLVLGIVLGGSYYYNRNRQFHEYDVEWQISAAENGYSEYLSFNDVILHYSQDGISCINQKGEVMWNQALNMDVPGIAVTGDYAVIYDIKGTSLYICNAEGVTGYAETTKKILKSDISASGVVAVVLDDKTSNYINYFRKDGSQIDLEIKTLISGDGYPLDIAISPDGTQLMSSYIYASSGDMMNQVVFRNFEVGKNNADRVVGGFKQYKQNLVPEVMYFDNQNSAAVTEQAIDFYSVKNAMEPELSRTQKLNSKIKTVFSNKEYIGVILEEEKSKTSEKAAKKKTKTVEAADEGTAAAKAPQEVKSAYKMLVFDKTGNEVFEQEIDFEYERADFSGDGIVVYNNSECAVYNMTGVCKYQKRMDMEIEGVMRFTENTLVIKGDRALRKLKLR
ncbi:MAG: DUF5711 family protein [Lachnospiraceae bacterium]|nr:DUF5711 family protein [Lachnospiraceae bacterium]